MALVTLIRVRYDVKLKMGGSGGGGGGGKVVVIWRKESDDTNRKPASGTHHVADNLCLKYLR